MVELKGRLWSKLLVPTIWLLAPSITGLYHNCTAPGSFSSFQWVSSRFVEKQLTRVYKLFPNFCSSLGFHSVNSCLLGLPLPQLGEFQHFFFSCGQCISLNFGSVYSITIAFWLDLKSCEFDVSPALYIRVGVPSSFLHSGEETRSSF